MLTCCLVPTCIGMRAAKDSTENKVEKADKAEKAK